MIILLTGATGYVGGRLLRTLEQSGYPVRCLVRRPELLKAVPQTEVVKGDLLDAASVERAMQGVSSAFYLAHSMGSKSGFEKEEEVSAANFARASQKAGIRKIIYLGGISHGDDLSPHLKSRQRVGRILAESGVPVIEFQASIIIGSGSLSFEMIRALVERLPLMTTPKWVNIKAQPIGIEDVVQYLIEALKKPFTESRVYEIGGPERMSYLDLMKEYGRQRGLRRLIIPVPVLSPGLSSLWLGLITPLYARVGRRLIESIRHETTVHNDCALREFSVRPMSVSEAISRALRNEDQEFAQTRWSDAWAFSHRPSWGGTRFGNRLTDSRRQETTASCEAAFSVIESIGGKNGWYYADALWRLRGFFDLLVGGVGMRRGRRNPNNTQVGEVIDCWRVEHYERGRRLRLYAEMKLPGRAWLDYELSPTHNGCAVTQTAIFDPVGLFGLIYWYMLWPAHQIIFSGMLRSIVKKAVTQKGVNLTPR